MGRSSRPFLVIPVRASPISQSVLSQLAKRLRKRQRRRVFDTASLYDLPLFRADLAAPDPRPRSSNARMTSERDSTTAP